jgi:formimidoylglutamate deiminase
MPHPQLTTRHHARYALLDERVIEDACVDTADGLITHVSARADAPALPPDAHTIHHGEVALMAGQVNAHSHAFQRAIRGTTQRIGASHEDFWSWRGRMYEAAAALDPDSMHRIARLAYDEMAAAGITSVGEFHYVHHQPDGAPYEVPSAMADAVIEAAREAGLRITLLRVAYHEAAPGKPAEGTQRRFASPSLDAYLTDTLDLAARWRGVDGVQIGVAPHSIRAVPRTWLGPIAQLAAEQGWPLHIHACEQRQEIAQSIAAYGCTPIELLADAGALGPHTTLVHATHLSARDLDLIEAANAIVCACPTTERDLGDGFLPALNLLQRGVRICVGSDSHSVIDPWEELRLIEYHERLRYERRGVLTAAHPRWWPQWEGERGVAELLLLMGARHGAQSIGQGATGLTAGQPADLIACDLTHLAMRGADAASLGAYVTLSMPTGAVRRILG